MIEDRVVRKRILLQILFEATKDSWVTRGQIGHSNRGAKRVVHQLQIELRIEHILDIGFLSGDKIGIGENMIFVKELLFIQVLDVLLVSLLVVDKDRNV